jgi:rubrerythrin
MYSKKDLVKILKRNLESETKIINFYIKNLEKINYPKNKKAITKMVKDSVGHAGMIATEILELQKDITAKKDKKTISQALREETAMKEIYKYEFTRTSEAKALKVLNKLIREETKHEKIVKTLK